MADHVAGPNTPASSRIAALHQLCDQDYAKGRLERARAAALARPPYAILSAPEPTDLDVAIDVAQLMLDSNDLLTMREALRLLLRALGAEPTQSERRPDPRCPAAHLEDPTPCDGPPTVTVLDRTNAGADGCAHHGASLLASLDGGRVYALPDAPPGSAIAVFKAAADTKPFPWLGRGEGK
jgi:hypothetical protein